MLTKLQHIENELAKLVSADDGSRFDAKYTSTLAQELEFIKTQTFDIKYPELRARMLIPVDNSVPTWAETWGYDQWDLFGAAAIISNYADDLPLVDVLKERFTHKVQAIGDGYTYSIQDLRRSAATGTAIDGKRSAAARRVIEYKIDKIGAVGEAMAGIPGVLNHPNVPLVTAVTGTWSGATGLQMIADMDFLVNSLIANNKETFFPDTIVMSGILRRIFSSKPMSADNTKTALSVFLENSDYINNIESWYECETTDAAGTGPRTLCYKRDPEVLGLVVPQEFEQFPPQAKNLAFKVPCHARVGGVQIQYPLAMAYMDGL